MNLQKLSMSVAITCTCLLIGYAAGAIDTNAPQASKPLNQFTAEEQARILETVRREKAPAATIEQVRSTSHFNWYFNEGDRFIKTEAEWARMLGDDYDKQLIKDQVLRDIKNQNTNATGATTLAPNTPGTPKAPTGLTVDPTAGTNTNTPPIGNVIRSTNGIAGDNPIVIPGRTIDGTGNPNNPQVFSKTQVPTNTGAANPTTVVPTNTGAATQNVVPTNTGTAAPTTTQNSFLSRSSSSSSNGSREANGDDNRGLNKAKNKTAGLKDQIRQKVDDKLRDAGIKRDKD